MKTLKTEQHILRCTVIQVMDFMVIELMRHGFKLAMENELADLKGLIDTDRGGWLVSEGNDTIDVDHVVLLLDEIEDPVVRRLVNSIDLILEFKWSFLNVSNMKQEDILLAEESYDAAADVFYTYAFDLGDDGSYASILESVHAFYWPADMIVFHCALLISIGAPVDMELAEDHYFNHYNLSGYEVPGKNSYTELLLKVMEGLQEDADAIDGFEFELKKRNNDGEI